MLIIACPCTPVLATPTAMVAAAREATPARLGILIKNVVQLEFARSLTAVVFDKTGTLTTGELSVSQLKPAPGRRWGGCVVGRGVGEQMSKHPRRSRWWRSHARRTRPRPSVQLSTKPPGGACRRTWTVTRFWSGVPAGWPSKVSICRSRKAGFCGAGGVSLLYVARGGRCLGWIGLEDRTRPEARAAIDELRKLNIRNLSMVTGDKWSVARRVGAEMGCTEVQAEVLPDEKLRLVDDLKRRGHKVAVIGDGVNDAPMLAASDLGIAMGAAGSDVAINSASIALMNNDLSRLPFLIRLSPDERRLANIILAWRSLW